MDTRKEKKIVHGPSREELFDALRLHRARDGCIFFKLEVDVIPHVVAMVEITGLSYDPCKEVVGEEGNEWLFTGLSQRFGRISGSYNTRRRVGILQHEQ